MNVQTNDAKKMEVVVGVFEDAATASRAARQLNGPEVELQRVCRNDPTADQEIGEIYYDRVDHVSETDVARGALTGGAIGAGSGLLFIGVPGLNIAAPIVGALAGAWIGAVAGIDEAWRGVQLPEPSEYAQLLSEGKSFVVIAGDQAERMKYAAKLQELGAVNIHQHPPVLEASLHQPKTV